ncbi:MAG TPA: ABC transporter ATP-binding protein [Bacteroidia bacterium]|nr:ABC transporter ATP-binding protein [Bacteroidia bacterium]
MSVAIRVEHLSKKYILKHQASEPYVALRDVITGAFRKSGSINESGNAKKEEFYALKDVSFEIQQGERIGIIGRNGAGKSTLLKILSRITEVTEGRVSIKGRVASLLEVGTGFHPELTGRENIFLNGSILGMSKSEIQRKFDEIVAFAEVEKFLDTAVKRYSSGMYVRLAFAVAAHLEPEILVVDEVLAVGDAEFQKKCLGKMKDVANSGRTILFVSHNMAAIQNLCSKAIYLNKGKLEMMGEREQVIATYLRSTADVNVIDLADRKDRNGNGAFRFINFSLKDNEGHQLSSFQSGKAAKICINIQRYTAEPLRNIHIAMGIDDEMGQRITNLNNDTTASVFPDMTGQKGTIEISIPRLPLRHGLYSFTLYGTVNNDVADWINNAGTFHVEHGDFFGTGKLIPDGQGNFYIDHQFKLL